MLWVNPSIAFRNYQKLYNKIQYLRKGFERIVGSQINVALLFSLGQVITFPFIFLLFFHCLAFDDLSDLPDTANFSGLDSYTPFSLH